MIRVTPKFLLVISGFLFVFFLLIAMQDSGEVLDSKLNSMRNLEYNRNVDVDNVTNTFVEVVDSDDAFDGFRASTNISSSVHENRNLQDLDKAGNEADVPGWEFNTSRNLQDYIDKDKMTATILPEHFCDQRSLLVIMVTSAPYKVDARQAIRETWGRENKVLGYNVSIYFLMGQTDDENIQKWVKWEAEAYKDIIQEDFKDTYNNLTIKSVSLLKLFNLVCSKTSQYVLKIDDDMFLSVPKLVAELAQRNESNNLVMGSVICNAGPIRDSSDKWYAPTYLFAESLYPRYTSGTGYLMSSDAAEKIFAAALKTPIFHLEDVYLTGICSKKAGIRPTHNPLFTYRYLPTDLCLFTQLITVHYQSPEGIREIYNATTDAALTERCAKSGAAFKVQKWMVKNVFMANKEHKRRECS